MESRLVTDKYSLLMSALLISFVSIVLMAACGSKNSSAGVARLDDNSQEIIDDEASPIDLQANNSGESSSMSSPTAESTTNLNDEEIATAFAECLRTEGINVSDPELNADGTVNMMALRQSIANDPNFSFQDPSTRETMQKCVPLLQNASFAGQRTQEDEIELQDNLLEIAQCLRDSGINAKDPDFSGNRGQIFQSMLSGLDLDRDSVRDAMSECSEAIFGNSGPGGSQGRGGGRPVR